MTDPRQITIERDGISFTVGDEGDFSWAEMDALQQQMLCWNAHHPKQTSVKKLSPEMLKAVLEVKKVFSGAVVEEWR
jgi:hypothetical protein